MITLDIKELNVNFPIPSILHITKCWLNKHNNGNAIRERALYLLKLILKPNYFQHNNIFPTRKRHCHGITHLKYHGRDLPSIF